MPGPANHEAYRDLDTALVTSYVTAWNNYWDDLGSRITDAIEVRDWNTAAQLIDSIDVSVVVDNQRQYAQTLFQTAMLLGVKNITEDVAASKVYASPPVQLVTAALDQVDTILNRNATNNLKAQGHRDLQSVREEIEAEERPEELVLKQDGSRITIDEKVRVKVSVGGRSFFALGPSMQLNRMRSLGFLMESALQGRTTYRIQATIDERTSQICLNLHGREFSVETGLNQLINILSGDPDAAKSLAPWPNAQTTSLVPSLPTGELETMGLGVPPYHPYCRTILVVTGGSLTAVDALQGAALATVAGGLLEFFAGAIAGEETEEFLADDLVFE